MALSTGAIIGIVFGVIGFIICHIPICLYFYKFLKFIRRRYFQPMELPEDIVVNVIANPDLEEAVVAGDEVKDGDSPMEIRASIPEITGVQIKKKIGEGNYGDVYLGSWNDTKVALKKLKSFNQYVEFKKEAGTLFTLVHPNCVQFLGIYKKEVDDVVDYYIVLEYLSRGNSLDLLRTEKSLTPSDLISMAISTSKGMTYLEKKGIVHSDLACRNLLVTFVEGKYQVKVSDFGLSMELPLLDQSNNQPIGKSGSVDSTTSNSSTDSSGKPKRIPIRWTAPEILKDSGLSTTIKSDVWSFGIVLWEMFSLGKLPYKELKNREVCKKVPEGYRLKKPSLNCPDYVYDLMLQCWNEDPSKRPSFSEITKELKKINRQIKNDESMTTTQRSDLSTEECATEEQEELYQTYSSRSSVSSGSRSPRISRSYLTVGTIQNDEQELSETEESQNKYNNHHQNYDHNDNNNVYKTLTGDNIVDIEKLKQGSNKLKSKNEDDTLINADTEPKLYHSVDGTRSYEINV